MRVLISHPFSGALYAFFTEHLSDYRKHPPRPRDPHPYYRTLFGDRFPEYQEVALTLAILFDEIVICPADCHLPPDDTENRTNYYNEDLGLHSEWNLEVLQEIREKVPSDLEDKKICRVLRKVPPRSQQQILCDARYELFLAEKHSCPIVASGGRRKIIERLIEKDAGDLETYDKASLRMASEYVRLMGLLFEPRDFDTLLDLKRNKELRSYAGAFVSAMDDFRGSDDVRRDLLLAIQKAIGNSEVFRNAAGIFDGSAAVLSVIGLIPGIGTVGSVLGLAATLSGMALEKKGRVQRWYEFGPQIRRFTSLRGLEKEIETELKKETGT